MKEIKRIAVLFVEPIRYGLELVEEVYESTKYEFLFVYCHERDLLDNSLSLPNRSIVLGGNWNKKKKLLKKVVADFEPNFFIINGYVGLEQRYCINYSKRKNIPYAIESDTPLNIPNNRIKAFLKKNVLRRRLFNEYCYGFPGGSLQKENLVYYGIPESRCFVMPMSVSRKRFDSAASRFSKKNLLKEESGLSGKTVFLFVGRLEEEKNTVLLIEAFKRLSNQGDSVTLLVVGDGSQRDMLVKRAAGNENIVFIGKVNFPEIVKYYVMSDVFVLPSKYEPWGLVVNEAMTMGLPLVLSSAVGSLPDLLKENVNGFSFESENTSSLLNSMSMIMKTDLAEFGRKSRSEIENWGFEAYLRRFVEAISIIEKQTQNDGEKNE